MMTITYTNERENKFENMKTKFQYYQKGFVEYLVIL